MSKPEIEWVDIPGGMFLMGSPKTEYLRRSEEKQHLVTLSAFKMSKYTITFEQYDAFCDATGSCKPGDEGWGRGKLPVINVSWEEANNFALWMGCRLPTEAEWEYACRAGTTTPFNTGHCLPAAMASYDGNFPYFGCIKGEFRKKTMPVGSFAPNAWGLCDMHGNVLEWCSDWYGKYSDNPQTDPQGPSTGSQRVDRGGSWGGSARRCRSARRGYCEPDVARISIGIRLASSR